MALKFLKRDCRPPSKIVDDHGCTHYSRGCRQAGFFPSEYWPTKTLYSLN